MSFSTARKIQTQAILFVTLYGIFPLIYSFLTKLKQFWIGQQVDIYINYYDLLC